MLGKTLSNLLSSLALLLAVLSQMRRLSIHLVTLLVSTTKRIYTSRVTASAVYRMSPG